MNIYIYGSSKFQENMEKVLKKAKLHNISIVHNIEELENIISEKPNDIYLIDSNKIVSKNFVTEKLNFLKPKDSIYKEYLEDVGIDDIYFNSDEALVDYIKDKMNIKNTYDNDNNEYEQTNVVDIGNFSKNENNEITKVQNMSDLSQLDDMLEEGVMDALDINNDVSTSNDIVNTKIKTIDLSNNDNVVNSASEDDTISNKEVHIDASNIKEITKMMEQLLQNKTLELLIKIKD